MINERNNHRQQFYFGDAYIDIWYRRSISGLTLSVELDARNLNGGRGIFRTIDQITDDRRAQEVYNTACDLLAKLGAYPKDHEADELHAAIFSGVRSMI